MIYLQNLIDQARRLTYLMDGSKQSWTINQLDKDMFEISYRECGSRKFLKLSFSEAVEFIRNYIQSL